MLFLVFLYSKLFKYNNYLLLVSDKYEEVLCYWITSSPYG